MIHVHESVTLREHNVDEGIKDDSATFLTESNRMGKKISEYGSFLLKKGVVC